MNVYGYNPFGYNGNLVSIDVYIKDETTAIDVAGIQEGLVNVFRAAVKATIEELGYQVPEKRVVIACRPCTESKNGRELVLASALAVIAKSEARLFQ